jgi:hypothetical protein
VLWLFGLACTTGKENIDSATESVEDCFAQTPSIEIGEGERMFEPFEEPYEAMMIHGPQGGWHILASLKTRGMMDIVEVYYTIEHLDTGTFVSDNTYRLAVVSEGECNGFYPGLYGYLSVRDLYDGDLDTPPELLGGDMLRMTLRVNDCTTNMESQGLCVQAERWAEATLDVLALLDPIDQESESSDTGDTGSQ